MASRVPFIDLSSNSHLIPPLGFSRVSDGVYRSAYPVGSSMPFLETLNLKSMICLCPNEIKEELQTYLETNKIKLLSFGVKVNQEPFLSMDDQQVSWAIEAALNPINQPTLIFCVAGKVKTSCIVACIRKAQGWSFSSITEEFEMFGEPEGGLCDLAYIHRFQPITREEE